MARKIILFQILLTLTPLIFSQNNRTLYLKNQTDRAVMPSPFGKIAPTEFSVEWWIKPNSFDDYNQCIGGGGWGTFRCHTTKAHEIYAGTHIDSRFEPYDFIRECRLTNSWQHLAFTYKRGTARLYLNGVFVASKTGMKYPIRWDGFYIGFFKEKSNMSFDGQIDDIRIWDVARTAEEIMQNKMTKFKMGTPHLKSYYHFDDNTHQIKDYSGNNNHGICSGCKFISEEIESVDFIADKTSLCINDTATFTNLSEGNPENSHYHWNFNGGIPSESNQKNPKVIYSKAGYYDVSLNLRIENKNLSKTSAKYIKVLPGNAVPSDFIRIASVTSEELSNTQTVSKCIDGNLNTFWSSGEEKNPNKSHAIIFSLKEELNINGIGYFQRKDGFNEGTVTQFKIYISNDLNDFGLPVCEGKWNDESSSLEKFATFDHPVKGKYLRFEIVKTIVDGTNIATCSEFKIYDLPEKKGHANIWLSILILAGLALVGLWYFKPKRIRILREGTLPAAINELPSPNTRSLPQSEFTVQTTQPYTTNIQLFGNLTILHDSTDYAKSLYPKLKHLFAFICIKSVEFEDGVSRKEIEDTLWGVGSMANASKNRANNTQSLKNALSEINNISLNPNKHSWRLNYSNDVYIDYMDYMNSRKYLEENKTNTIKSEILKNFLDIIEKGKFLNDLKEDWAEELRNKLNFDTIDILHELLLNQSNLTENDKLRICDAIHLMDDLDEVALRKKIDIYNSQNKQSASKNTLEAFRKKYQITYNKDFDLHGK